MSEQWNWDQTPGTVILELAMCYLLPYMNLEDIYMTSGLLCVKEDDKVVQPLEELVRISIQWK